MHLARGSQTPRGGLRRECLVKGMGEWVMSFAQRREMGIAGGEQDAVPGIDDDGMDGLMIRESSNGMKWMLETHSPGVRECFDCGEDDGGGGKVLWMVGLCLTCID